jgi:uncharacterized protein
MKGWLMTHWHARPRGATTDEREQLVQEIVPLLRAREEVIFAYLHGSFITKDAFRYVDLALYMTATSVLNMNLRRYEIDTGVDFTHHVQVPIDVRVLNDAPLAFRYHVVKGRLLFTRDDEFLDVFRVRTWDEYCDFAPFARRYLREAIGE